MLIYFSEEIILPWAGHYPKFRKKKNALKKLHAQDTTSNINTLLRECREQAHFPSLLFCSLVRKDNIRHSETRLLISI